MKSGREVVPVSLQVLDPVPWTTSVMRLNAPLKVPLHEVVLELAPSESVSVYE